jgi:hypothetical protein
MRFAILWVFMLCVGSQAHGRTWYVSARSGSDNASGISPTAAFKTIQKACGVVEAGDTVIVSAGVYFGPIELRRAGTSQNPIVFKTDGVAKNRVVVTNADPQVRAGKRLWALEDEALQLYSVPFDHMPVRGLYDDVDLLPYPTLDGLKTFMISAKMPGPRHGMAFDAPGKKLYVRLHPDGKYGSTDPNRHMMSFAPPAGRGDKGEHLDQPGSYAWGVLTEGPAHVVLDGFTFESAGVTGIYIRGSQATVRNCWFFGCRFGVAGGATSDNDQWSTDNVVVEYCYYTQFPAFSDLKEILEEYSSPQRRATVDKFFWFGRKGAEGAIPDAYEYESGLTLGMGSDWVLRHNHLYECFDGLSQIGLGRSKGAQIHHNRFERMVDNAIETENHAADLRIHDNEIADAFMPISWQPLGGTPWPGPVYIYRNLITNTPATTALWRKVDYPEAAFKLGAHDNNWKPYNKQMAEVPKDAVSIPGDGFLVYNNTVVMPGAHFLERVNGTASRKLLNFHFFNNIFVMEPAMNKGAPLAPDTGLQLDYNLFSSSLASEVQARIIAGPHGLVLRDPTKIGFVDMTTHHFELKPNSPAVRAGMVMPNAPQSSSTLGAIPAGAIWQSPLVGPQGIKPQ